MLDYIMFWLAAVLVAVGIVVFTFICLMGAGAWITFKEWRAERKCAHLSYVENRACHGICTKCRKDLGLSLIHI